MAMGIERKFLFKGEIPSHWRGLEMTQGVLKHDDPHIRVRLYASRAFLTVKGKMLDPDSTLLIKSGPPLFIRGRPEWEYEIPLEEANEMLATCTYKIEKTRYVRIEGLFTWDVDVFHGDNEGLIVAKIELDFEGETFDLPEWVGVEVTADPRYLNSNLSTTPYNSW